MDSTVSSKGPRRRWFPYFSSYDHDGGQTSQRIKNKLRRRALYQTPLSAVGISRNNDDEEFPNHPSSSQERENEGSMTEDVNNIDNSKGHGKEGGNDLDFSWKPYL